MGKVNIMQIITSETNGKHLIENRYLKGKTEIKYVYGWERDPKANYSTLVQIGDRVNAVAFAKKISKKVGRCRAVMCAMQGGDSWRFKMPL